MKTLYRWIYPSWWNNDTIQNLLELFEADFIFIETSVNIRVTLTNQRLKEPGEIIFFYPVNHTFSWSNFFWQFVNIPGWYIILSSICVHVVESEISRAYPSFSSFHKIQSFSFNSSVKWVSENFNFTVEKEFSCNLCAKTRKKNRFPKSAFEYIFSKQYENIGRYWRMVR